MPVKRKVARYYAYPRPEDDGAANKFLSEVLDRDKDFYDHVLCADGKYRPMWDCGAELSDLVQLDPDRSKLRIDIYELGSDGIVRKRRIPRKRSELLLNPEVREIKRRPKEVLKAG